jgi:predicted ATPase
MLTQLKVKNFRLLRDITLDFTPGVPNIAIGPNSSGKSSLVEVFDFLRTAVTDGLDRAVYRDRQGPSDFFSADATGPIEIDLSFFSPRQATIEGSVSLGTRYFLVLARSGPYIRVEREEFRFARGTEPVELLPLLVRRESSCTLLNEQTQIFDELTVEPSQLAFTAIGQRVGHTLLSSLQSGLRTLFTYPGFLAVPWWTRDPREGAVSPRESSQLIPVERLDPRGLDLINALYSLNSYHPRRFERLLYHFTREFPFVERLTFPPDPGGARLALGWSDKRFSGVTFRAHQMSSGMIQFLSLLTAILAPAPAVLLAFDEPESHLHPSAIRRLVSLLEEKSEDTAILVATHSSQLLDYLDQPAKSVLTCERGPNGIEFGRFEEAALKDWLSAFSMSELRRKGHLDPWNDRVAELI